MKKILFLAMFIAFTYPTISYASWWNPFSWGIIKQLNTVTYKIIEPASLKNLSDYEKITTGKSDGATPGFISDEEMAKIERQDAKVKAEKEDALLWGRLVIANDGYEILNQEVKGKVIKFFKTYKKYDPKYGTSEGSDYKKLDDKWWENFDIHKGDSADRLYSAHQDLLLETSSNTTKKNPIFLGKECLDEYCSLEIKMEIAKRELENAGYDGSTQRLRARVFTDETSQSLSSGSTINNGYHYNYAPALSAPTFDSTLIPQSATYSSFDIKPTAGAGSYYIDSFGNTKYKGDGVSGTLKTDSMGTLQYSDSAGYSASIKADPFGGIRYNGNDGTSGTIKTDPFGTINYQSSSGIGGTVKTDPFGNTRYYNNDGGTLTCSEDFMGVTNCH